MSDFYADSERLQAFEAGELPGTGILVRARTPRGGYEPVDICLLQLDSLTAWLDGLDAEALRRTIRIIFGHGVT